MRNGLWTNLNKFLWALGFRDMQSLYACYMTAAWTGFLTKYLEFDLDTQLLTTSVDKDLLPGGLILIPLGVVMEEEHEYQR